MPRRLVVGSVGSALVAVALALAGCSSSEAPPAAPDPVAELQARFEGQGIEIVPFDLENEACQADPETMSAASLATCAHISDGAGYNVTTDPRTFDVAPDRKMMLVVYGPTIDPARSGWVGLVGLGPLPKQGGQLVQGSTATTSIRPQIVPLLVIGGYELLEAAIAAGVAYYGAKAVVATVQTVQNHNSTLDEPAAAPIVQSTKALVERQSKLINCTPDEHELLKQAKQQACPDPLPGDCTKSSSFTSSYCVQLSLRRGEYQKCLDARNDVTNRCFGGVNDKEHQVQIDNMTKSISTCDQLISASCGG